MINWLYENREWLFSGIGITALMSIYQLIKFMFFRDNNRLRYLLTPKIIITTVASIVFFTVIMVVYYSIDINILTYIIMLALLLSFLSVIVIVIHSINKSIVSTIIMGMPATGKTSMLMRLYMPSGGLEHTMPTMSYQKYFLRNVICADKLKVVFLGLDTPGNDYVSIIDTQKKGNKRVFIFVISPTTSCRLPEAVIDDRYIEKQYIQITTILNMYLKSRKYKQYKPYKIIFLSTNVICLTFQMWKQQLILILKTLI